jgi:hypothetical protein
MDYKVGVSRGSNNKWGCVTKCPPLATNPIRKESLSTFLKISAGQPLPTAFGYVIPFIITFVYISIFQAYTHLYVILFHYLDYFIPFNINLLNMHRIKICGLLCYVITLLWVLNSVQY